ncbi:MAG: class I SAM-dependent methyltransferase [Proteobacteria bacterium]|nr:class I SAM-dependent methyltransferase [Pseudomonadota bacterium]
MPRDKKRTYARIARFYDFLDGPFEKSRYRTLRPRLFEGLSGRILDAGVGTGRNIDYYPPESEVTGIDLSPAMLSRARKRRDEAGRAVELMEMDARRTTFPDGHFDAVVASFLFCVLDYDDQLPALKELGRVCKPGGEIRLLEYCYSEDPRQRFVMRLWAPWVHWAYGARFDRDTERYIDEAGLTLRHKEFVYGDTLKLLILAPPDGPA